MFNYLLLLTFHARIYRICRQLANLLLQILNLRRDDNDKRQLHWRSVVYIRVLLCYLSLYYSWCLVNTYIHTITYLLTLKWKESRINYAAKIVLWLIFFCESWIIVKRTSGCIHFHIQLRGIYLTYIKFANTFTVNCTRTNRRFSKDFQGILRWFRRFWNC